MSEPVFRPFNVDAAMSRSACYNVDVDLNAVWIPFGSTGGNELSVEADEVDTPPR